MVDSLGSRPNSLRRRQPFTSFLSVICTVVLAACLFGRPGHAVRVPLENCLPDSSREGDPPPLQWEPLYVDARIDTEDDNHSLSVILWGNVSGSHFQVDLPSPDDDHWEDDDETDGKIDRVPADDDARITTLVTEVNFLTYRPYRGHDDFCQDKLTNASCPLSPIFDTADLSIPYDLPSVNFTNDFSSSYAFGSLSTTFIVIYGDSRATNIGCASSVVTPDLGSLGSLITWLPLFVLVLVGFATTYASVFSPWGTTDVFRWTSNFGRDADLLRLVTPGFGDCLQYMQFVVLTGGLTLDYPGFYQPILSRATWSVLMFNESLVSDKPSWEPVQDGIYVTNATHGLEELAQLVGIPDVEDIWVGMMVWLLAIIGALLVLIQIGFFVSWIWRLLSSTAEEDLRAKNMPFSVGNVIRVVFNYFFLPIVALSCFQLVVAGESAGWVVALAVVTIVILMVFAGWLFFLILRTKPRAVLFDDLPTVLLYGPLYNTYSDEAATFALVPVVLTFVRGIAIGAVQPAGIAQIVVLAICEVVQVLALHAWRPFSSPTSMNAYHTLFSVVRFLTVMLMVAFIPELGVTEGPKGWIGYVILVIHAGVLVLGFFLNAMQTTVEVTARLLGARGEDGLERSGLAKIFGMRQLQRRMSRRTAGPSRQSQLSSTAMLDAEEGSKAGFPMRNGRVRSESGGSAMLLRNHNRNSSALDSIDALSMPPRTVDNGSIMSPNTPGQASTFSFLPSAGGAARSSQPALPMEAADPYYRPPRRRADTLSGSMTSDRPRQSLNESKRYSQVPGQPLEGTEGEAPPPAPAERANTPAPISINLTPRADYSTREVDFYYGVRGPALNSEGPGRKLGTGPADPTGPMASAAGWFRSMFGGKTKDKGKGFEVVRSARMPPAMRAGTEFSDDAPPEGIPVAMGVIRNGPIESDDDEPTKKKPRKQPGDLLTGEGEAGRGADGGAGEAPTLPSIEYGESLKFPSREPSKASKQLSREQQRRVREPDPDLEVPEVPRKSSKRQSGISYDHSPARSANLVPPGGQQNDSARSSPARSPASHLPFERSTPSQEGVSGSTSLNDDYSQVDLNDASPSPDDRPKNFGVVPQHSTARVDPDHREQVGLLGTSAEIVDERSSPESRAF